MNQNTLKVASGMLRAVISGASCDEVANQYGVSKSAVSQRVRLLASELQQVVGVVGYVSHQGIVFNVDTKKCAPISVTRSALDAVIPTD